MAEREINPLAVLERDLRALQREGTTKPRWDPANAESLIDWLEQEFGVVVRAVPKISGLVRELISDLQARRRIRVLVIGPRGGGKTMLAAAIQLLSVRFFGASWTSIGGSLEQATRLFAHVRGAIERSADLQRFVTEALASRITAKNGGAITVHAASEKSIRGQHPRGPSGAGGIVLDEAALIEDRLVDAAIPQVASADPSMILQLSTLGEHQSGRFWELIQNHAERGYRVYEFGIFDVVARCPYECATTCPVPAFAKDEHREDGQGKITSIRKALCAGKAHEPDGWVSIDEVAQQYKDLPRDSFQREFLGASTTRVGAVYNTEDIDTAVNRCEDLTLWREGENPEQHRHRHLRLEKSVGIDWGYSGEAWAVYTIRCKDTLAVYRWECWSHTRFSEIRRQVLNHVFQERIQWILPDAANPSDNQELQTQIMMRQERPLPGDDVDSEWTCKVQPIAFSKFKGLGIGEVRRRLENQLLVFPQSFGGEPLHNFERAIRLLKAYHLDQNGQPVKKDDHCCDALLMAVLKFSPRNVVDPTAFEMAYDTRVYD